MVNNRRVDANKVFLFAAPQVHTPSKILAAEEIKKKQERVFREVVSKGQHREIIALPSCDVSHHVSTQQTDHHVLHVRNSSLQ